MQCLLRDSVPSEGDNYGDALRDDTETAACEGRNDTSNSNSPHNQAKAEFSTPRDQVLSANRNFSKRQESRLEAYLSASVFTSVMA